MYRMPSLGRRKRNIPSCSQTGIKKTELYRDASPQLFLPQHAGEGIAEDVFRNTLSALSSLLCSWIDHSVRPYSMTSHQSAALWPRLSVG